MISLIAINILTLVNKKKLEDAIGLDKKPNACSYIQS